MALVIPLSPPIVIPAEPALVANAAQQPRTVLKSNLVGCLPDPQSRVNCPTKQQQERERVPKQAKKPSSYDLINKLGRTQASISILFALLQLTKKFSKNSLRVPRSRRAPPQQTFQIRFCWNFNGSLAISLSDNDLPDGITSPHIRSHRCLYRK